MAQCQNMLGLGKKVMSMEVMLNKFNSISHKYYMFEMG
jgi:hypothetical protein